MGNCINAIAFLFPKKKCVYGLLNGENIEKMPEHISGNIYFISLWKFFSLLRHSNFKILESYILWRHEMLKHEMRNML